MAIMAKSEIKAYWYKCPNCQTVMWCKEAGRYQCIAHGCYRMLLYLHYDVAKPPEAAHEFQVWNPGSYYNHGNRKYGGTVYGPTRLDWFKAKKEQNGAEDI
jgi:hypothetical protein